MDNKKPLSSNQSGRRKSGGSIQLRSPVVKRLSAAPVALQGWLHKQGSEGLMLWKKRWFVLSEYCLFYYKGPEEEKLLGSILLPSYKISQCTADDKVYRKFAFKAEHANMRTYYFAAETRELMNQWINALSMASLLQEGSKLLNQNHGNTGIASTITAKPMANNCNFGFADYNSCSGPITIQPTSQGRNFKEDGENLNGWVPSNSTGPCQPLYANAPPKPKRMNSEGQYLGSSPETSPSRRNDAENILYGSHRRFQENNTPIRLQDYQCNSYQSGYVPGSDPDSRIRSQPHSGNILTEKTLDNISWNSVKSPNFSGGGQKQEEHNSGYSNSFKTDIHNFKTAQKPEEINFSHYGNNSVNYSAASNYQHPNQYYQSYQQASQPPFDSQFQYSEYEANNQTKRWQPPRPHSADFLDYDAKKFYPSQKHLDAKFSGKYTSQIDHHNSTRPPRPKSSLDIVHSNDGYYWSEEHYAEKMRQSAIYFQNTLPQRFQSSRANTPIAKLGNDFEVAVPDSGTTTTDQLNTNARSKKLIEFGKDQTKYQGRQNLRRYSEHQMKADSFMRSASARLPKVSAKSEEKESDEVQAYTGGEDFSEGRKEESMKRLLEWKQRMLQSPLTRKSSGSSTRGVAQNELSKCYKQQALKELEKQEAKSKEELEKKKMKTEGAWSQNRMSDSRLSSVLSPDRYHSYSSDDEENEEFSVEERVRRTSQTMKPRKDVDEVKGKISGKAVNFNVFPNYENVAHSPHESSSRRYACQSPDRITDMKQTSNKDLLNALEVGALSKRERYGERELKLKLSCENRSPEPYKKHSHLERKHSEQSINKPETLKEDFGFSVNCPLKGPNWNEKIDEIKLIKEFSYQYISDPEIHEVNSSTSFEEGMILSENLTKGRVKLSELPDTESQENDAVIQEPLKVSSSNYYSNEAHISHLKSKETRDKLKFPASDKPKHFTSVIEKQQKSVKDLLADFEKKSQLAQEREEHEKSSSEIAGKRCGFSDTETLLYDTSSDAEDKKVKSDPWVLPTTKKSKSRKIGDALTEEDRDDEVADTMGRRERLFTSNRNSASKGDSAEYLVRNKILSRSSDLALRCSPSSEIEKHIAQGYLKSTLTDSIGTLENSDSACSTPTIDRIKDNLTKMLPAENLNKKIPETTKEKENCEGHYMPMTPSKRVSAPSSDKSRSNSSLHSFLFGIDPEETYVEMAENGGSGALLGPNKLALSNIKKSYPDADDTNYTEVMGGNSKPHDFFYPQHGSMLREPEYMEVNTLLEILKEQDEKLKEHKDAIDNSPNVKSNQDNVPPTPPRSTLPDILNSSASQRTTKSDSSDADDESSKDLDSLDIPRHPRFSLSDTFRPASYYLGGAITDRDRNLLRLRNSSENHDSSDSDLVSPPPIPTSPPPLDDIDTSLETERSLEIRSQNQSKFKIGGIGGKKLWDFAVGNNSGTESSEQTVKKKRRPVSEDTLSILEEAESYFLEKSLVLTELDSIGNRSGLALDDNMGGINLDQYLEDLNLNSAVNGQTYAKNFTENIYKSTEKEIHKNLITKVSNNKTHSADKCLLKMTYSGELSKREEPSHERSKSMEEVQYENIQTLFPPPPPELYDSGNENSDREKDSSLAIYKNIAFPEVPPPENYCDVYEPSEKPKICFDPNTLVDLDNKSSSCFENQGAPYYYSDIIKDNDADIASSNSDRSILPTRSGGHRSQPLNNQRDHLQESNQCSKRNDIGRKVNPICQNYSPAPMESNDVNDVQKITAALRSTSAHFMGAADKTDTIDARNLYESDTLQRKKTSLTQTEERCAKTPDAHHLEGIFRNIYSHSLRDKSISRQGLEAKFLFVSQNRSRSISVEGLLNDLNYFRKEDKAEVLTTRAQTSNNTPSDLVVSERNHLREGEELWDKDTLWRGNLRKVSLRHTRSLDNLDDDITWNSSQRRNAMTDKSEVADKFRSGRRSVDHFDQKANTSLIGRNGADYLSKSKLSRNVTYVNDMVRSKKLVGQKAKIHETCEDESRSVKKENEIRRVVELNEPDVLEDNEVLYEKLIRTPWSKDVGTEGFKQERKWDKQRDEFLKRNQSSSKESLLKDSRSPLLLDKMTAVPCDGSTNDCLQTKSTDKEKLSQRDTAPGGKEVQEALIDPSEVKDSNIKRPKDPIPEPDLGEYVVVKRCGPDIRPLELTSSSEASGSGSGMREPLSPASASNFLLPRSNGSQSPQKILSHSTAPPATNSIKGDEVESKLTPGENSFLGSTDSVENCDPSPDLQNISYDYGCRNDGAYENKGDDFSEEREDFIMSRPERGKLIIESGHYVDQYQDRKLNGYQRQNLMMSNTDSGFSYSPNLHGCDRTMDTLDARGHSGKENLVKRKISPNTWGIDMSAGELLGRTHEELVLLLIQLRRQSASVCKAMESCHIEIEEQARYAELDTPRRMEHIRKLEKLKKHLLELEKQYEKGKPLVNLVDNMVKLGSLYKGNNLYNGSMGLDHRLTVREKLEFNQKVQEQRLLAEERRDWDRLSSDHGQLQAKVQQLYKLDKLLQEESGTLHVLQQDKELLEKALGGLRHKLQVNRSNPVEADRCRKQQKLIEKELSRVRLLLAHNSKKLEETVAENARLEQELVILRQKLQAGRVNSRNSVPLIPESTTTTTAILEAELRRVQQLVGDLQRQRHELSAQVKQLTEKSDTLVQQIRPGPTGVAGAGPIPGKKKSSATWLETDLDLLVTQDVGVESQVINPQLQQPVVMPNSRNTIPIYINTDATKKESMISPTGDSKSCLNLPLSSSEEPSNKAYCTPVELSEADEKMKRFYGIIPKEKQEIKTVRIVKRESERRQRDRDRSGNIGIPIANMAVAKRVSVIEENDGCNLGRVEEESPEAAQGSPGYNDVRDEPKNADFKNHDPYLNFHPTNPFLPKNMTSSNLNDVLMVDVNHAGKRCLSLPRGFGKNETSCWSHHQKQQQQPNQPLNKLENNPALRNGYSRRNKLLLENHMQNGSGNESNPNSPKGDQTPAKNYNSYSTNLEDYLQDRKNSNILDPEKRYSMNENCTPLTLHTGRLRSEQKESEIARKEKVPSEISRPLTAREQLFGSGCNLSEEASPQLSPVYQSEAAREIIMEMSSNLDSRLNGSRVGANRRQIRKEKRRHHTVSNIRPMADSVLLKMGSTRSRDDLDMERALRPRINAPDVVRSTMNHKDLKYNESTIDNILGTPNKIVIPERYIPEQEPLLTAEEQMQRSRKAESIRKMLSETTALSTPDLSSEGLEEERKSCTLRKKVEEEKKQREHLLELNQILAQQVMEKSKLVAVKAMASHQVVDKENDNDDKDLSPVQPLPIYQQRENFYS